MITFFSSGINSAIKFGMFFNCFSGDHNISAVFGRFNTNGFTDTTTRTSDEHCLSGQSSVVKQFCRKNICG